MIKQHLRQAWTMMKQQKLFTSIYIAGTAISIAMAMTIFVILYIKLGPLYPEENRNKMVIANDITLKDGEDIYGTKLNGDIIERIKKESKYIKNATARESNEYKQSYITSDDGKKEITLVPGYVDSDFWKVFNFNFIKGRPFTKKEENSPVAVITTSLADKLYAGTNVVGRNIYIDTLQYSIIGVVESQHTYIANNLSGGDIFAPLHYSSYFNETNNSVDMGWQRLIMTTETPQHCDSLKKEVKDIFSRIIQEKSYRQFSNYELNLYNHWQLSLQVFDNSGFFDAVIKYLYILLAFLFIPALNLCGLISTRMNSRLAEIGVRKVYGATGKQIISQVLCENMLLTVIGAVIGFILSYIFVYRNNEWLITLFDNYIRSENIGVNAQIFFNPTIIGLVFIISIVLNIASALLPTVIALKKDIVQSLYQRR